MENLENEHAFEELQETRANDVDEIVEPNKYEPALGMLFDNHEEMFAFYKAYGKQEGFPVKVRGTKKGTNGIVKYATFACGRRGKSESKSTNALKSKPNVKNGCDAKIGGYLNEDGKWVLRTLNLQHNHGLSPDKFVKQYKNALRRKAELEWQADAKCFSKRTPCVSRYEMERQVEEVYTIFKFKNFKKN
ncbi:protein FAR1-RELATED SEQUENCE 7-like [Citrus sinensis]|uniref:protein FAR1-RELATED SEQUENCE 7-like n=1 Tax=Citrus clementina TaxID=85681 RepID=UPI000CED0DCA|nr:protein FAR1-RELATED SEQUENCE 7-like [Citrus x clementina]XP_052299690.1 protein FAR1-RELATED SEQUENCE 7-like [Citrus sinensis]